MHGNTPLRADHVLLYVPPMHPSLILPALLLAAPALAANMATCLLDKLPATQNDVAAQAVFQVCSAEHPGGIQAVPQGDGRGMLGFKSGPECTVKRASDTRSTRAAELIGLACRRLYDEDGPWNRYKAQP